MLTFASCDGIGPKAVLEMVARLDEGVDIHAKVAKEGKDAVITASSDGRLLRAVGTAKRAAASIGWWLHGHQEGADSVCRCLQTGMGFGRIQKAVGSRSYR